jgi:hypothetical protein
VLFPFRMLGMHSLAFIGEWQPPAFGSRLQPLEIIILAGFALGFSGKVRVPPIRLLILLGLVHGALLHARHQQLLGIVGALVLAESFGTSLACGPAAASGRVWRRLAPCAVLVALAALAGRMALPLGPERSGAAFAHTLDRLPPSLRAQPVLNDYSLGGKLIFNRIRPFIDSRADLYGDAFLTRYSRIVAPDRAEFERTLAEYGIMWTIFPAGNPLVQVLDEEPGWRRLVEEGGIVIHTRGDPIADDPMARPSEPMGQAPERRTP